MARIRLVATAVAALVGAPTRGNGATTAVAPGTGTLQAAIDAANPGDVLLLREDSLPLEESADPTVHYLGPVTVTKQLTIRSPSGSGWARIDAGCGNAVAVDVAADGVKMRGASVRGGTVHGLRVVGRSGIKLKGVQARDTCNASASGIEIDDVGTLKGDFVDASGFPVGMRVANLAAGARVAMKHSLMNDSTTGLLFANVAPRTLLVTKCQSSSSDDAAISLQNADGVRVKSCVILGSNPGTSRGIVVDADSDDNSFQANQIAGNLIDVVDDGMSNCWRLNFHPFGELSGNPSTLGCN